MKKFDRNEGRGFGGRDRAGFGGRDNFSDRKEMHRAVCSDCGKNCEVPFRPSGSKPVFCNDCFRGHDQSPVRGTGRDRDFTPNPRRFEERAPRNNFSSALKNNSIEDRITALHTKLDKIISLLSNESMSEVAVKEMKVEPIAKESKKEHFKKKIEIKAEKKTKKIEPKEKKVTKKSVKKVAKK